MKVCPFNKIAEGYWIDFGLDTMSSCCIVVLIFVLILLLVLVIIL